MSQEKEEFIQFESNDEKNDVDEEKTILLEEIAQIMKENGVDEQQEFVETNDNVDDQNDDEKEEIDKSRGVVIRQNDKSERKKILLAVGYEITLSEEMKKFMKRYISENDEDFMKDRIQVAIWFAFQKNDRPTWRNKVTPPKGITEENCQEPVYVENWYKKKVRQGGEFKAKLLELYVSGKGTLIVAVLNCNGDMAYAFLYNKNKVATSMIKKALHSGHYGVHNLVKVKFKNQYQMDAKPYIHYI
jgi:hypothetical protein